MPKRRSTTAPVAAEETALTGASLNINRGERRMPVQIIDVTLTGDYEGWHATMRRNPPMRVLGVLEDKGSDWPSFRAALESIILSWDFVDSDGRLLPQPNEGGIEDCSSDLLAALMDAYMIGMREATGLKKASGRP